MSPTIYTSHLMIPTLWSHLILTNQNLEHIKRNSDCYIPGISLPLTEWVCPFSVHEIEGGSVERLNTDKFPSWDEQASLVLSSLENRIAVTRDQRIFDTSDWLYKGHTCLFMLVKDMLHTAKLIVFSEWLTACHCPVTVFPKIHCISWIKVIPNKLQFLLCQYKILFTKLLKCLISLFYLNRQKSLSNNLIIIDFII